jgi:hypothetical protein
MKTPGRERTPRSKFHSPVCRMVSPVFGRTDAMIVPEKTPLGKVMKSSGVMLALVPLVCEKPSSQFSEHLEDPKREINYM